MPVQDCSSSRRLCKRFDWEPHRLACLANFKFQSYITQVVKAVATQLATLNTNARYLHDNLVSHAELIAGTMPSPLEVTRGFQQMPIAVYMAVTLEAFRIGLNLLHYLSSHINNTRDV